MSLDAMKQALAALELLARYENPATKIQVRKPRDGGSIVTMYPHKVASEAATALRAAIEQAQEPVAHTLNCVCGAVWDVSPDGVEEMVHAPTPPPRQWQGLTEQEIKDCEKQAMVNGALPFEQRSFFARALEAKLKEKNT